MIDPGPPHRSSESKNEPNCPKRVGNAQKRPAGTRVIIHLQAMSCCPGVEREGESQGSSLHTGGDLNEECGAAMLTKDLKFLCTGRGCTCSRQKYMFILE